MTYDQREQIRNGCVPAEMACMGRVFTGLDVGTPTERALVLEALATGVKSADALWKLAPLSPSRRWLVLDALVADYLVMRVSTDMDTKAAFMLAPAARWEQVA